MTSDRFIGRCLRSIAHELGYSPSFELVLDGRELFDAAFEAWTTEVATDGQLQDLIALLLDVYTYNEGFIWDPYGRLRDRTRQLYEHLTHRALEPACAEAEVNLHQLQAELQQVAAQIRRFITQADAPVSRNFQKLLEDAEGDHLEKLVGRKLDQKAFNSHARQQALEEELQPLRTQLKGIVARYVLWQARYRPMPALQAYQAVRDFLQQQQQAQAQVWLNEGTRTLHDWLCANGVHGLARWLGALPEHLLIDEFQDTSPAQWVTLKHLAEHGLQNGGSLFVVGDTKQAIYGFRGGDWRIMAALQEQSPFPEVRPSVRSLQTNFRSDGKIVQFVRYLFERRAPLLLEEDVTRQCFRQSGLHRVK